ncbi:MAG: hypothetical protein LBQ66_04805 [Planctomycetaceae bacterium]|nr:hypothetical protein [Planctomycetaceae bacterium]
MPMRAPLHCFRLASLAENTTAQRSVAHLTLTMLIPILFWLLPFQDVDATH